VGEIAVRVLLLVAVLAAPKPTTLLLDVPARKQHGKAPPAGWCGETAIQEALLHFGVWASQRIIHGAGNSVHPDLYSSEIPTALSQLGVGYVAYGPKAKGFAAYESFVRGALDSGDPVLAGVKILPTEHPAWGLDHFVLVVGHGDKGLLVNTTWGTRVWANDTTTKGISFKNAFYALRLTGVARSKGAFAARLTVLEETPSTVKLRVECAGKPGEVRVERRKHAWDVKPEWSQTVKAVDARVVTVVTVDAESQARFQCVGA